MQNLEVEIRDFDPARDTAAVELLDTSLSSNVQFVVLRNASSLSLVRETLPAALVKRFPVHRDPWQTGYVAEYANVVSGFVAVGMSEWNRRLTIWHFYVDSRFRRRGIGRRLMDRALARGRELGAAAAWLETSSVNGTGVKIHQHLGFEISGFDLTLYSDTPAAGEFALFLSRPLSAAALDVR
jgi:ribosomal protein S18 acetylase RimI-like enzyme